MSSAGSIVKANSNPKVFTANTSKNPRVRRLGKIPPEILENEELNKAIGVLPANYDFEIHKCIWKIREGGFKCVAIQFPEGLLLFATAISDIIEEFTGADVIIMADATYGACCVDDYTAVALGAEFMIHYGHSCLIPVQVTNSISMYYVGVQIKIDYLHFIESLKHNFTKDKTIALVSTFQFVATIQSVSRELNKEGYKVILGKSSPLSPGEILGCTSAKYDEKEVGCIVYLGDGRFHIESSMISNPLIPAYRYNPYDKVLSKETYDFNSMMHVRKQAIDKASKAKNLGLILGTLGRQGNPKVLENLKKAVKPLNKDTFIFLLPEVMPDRLELFPFIEAWVQIACPRLSIDWGLGFHRPVLTPYELQCVVDETRWNKDEYPMDFYTHKSLGPWTPNHKEDLCSNTSCTCK